MQVHQPALPFTPSLLRLPNPPLFISLSLRLIFPPSCICATAPILLSVLIPPFRSSPSSVAAAPARLLPMSLSRRRLTLAERTHLHRSALSSLQHDSIHLSTSTHSLSLSSHLTPSSLPRSQRFDSVHSRSLILTFPPLSHPLAAADDACGLFLVAFLFFIYLFLFLSLIHSFIRSFLHSFISLFLFVLFEFVFVKLFDSSFSSCRVVSFCAFVSYLSLSPLPSAFILSSRTHCLMRCGTFFSRSPLHFIY